MKRWHIMLIIIIIFLMLTIVFFPKHYVKGGLAGFIGPGETAAYKQEYSCFGFKYSYYPKGCTDCGNIYNCYGVPYGKECYIERFVDGVISKEPTNCK